MKDKIYIYSSLIVIFCLLTAQCFAQIGSSPCNAFQVNFTPNPCDTTNAFILPLVAPTTVSPAATVCMDYNIQSDVWVKFTVPNYPSSGVRFKMYSGSDSLGYQLYQSTSQDCNNLTIQDCHIVKGGPDIQEFRNKQNGRFAFYNSEVAVGQTYWLRLWETQPQASPIIFKTGVVVLNDDCTNAFELQGTSCNYGAFDTNEPDSWTPNSNIATTAACTNCSGCLSNWGANDNGTWYTFSVTASTQQPIEMTISDIVCYDGQPMLQLGIYTHRANCNLAQEQLMACNVGVGQLSLSNVNLPVGNYYLFLDGSAGAQCQWSFSSPQLLGNLSTNGPKCAGEPVTLRVRNRTTTGSTYTYQFGGGNLGALPADTARTYTVTSPVPGTYYVTITETLANGSTQTLVAQINVAFAPVPVPTSLSPVTLRCGNSCGTINVGNGLGTYTKFRWSNGDSTQIAKVCQRGLYTVTVTNGYGCSATGTTVVDSVQVMFLNTSMQQYANCQGNKGIIRIDSVIGGVQRGLRYWIDNLPAQAQTTSPIYNINAGRHIVWARDSIGCTASDTLIIARADTILSPLKIAAHTIIGDCDGKNGIIVIDTAQGGAGQPYTFKFNNTLIPSSGSMIFGGLNTGDYLVSVNDTLFCRDTLLLNIPQRYYPKLQYTAHEPLIFVGESSELRPTVTRGRLIQWLWNNPADLSCYHCEKPIARPEITTTYTVTATDDNTCSVTRTVTVQVRSRLDVYAPNIITPNNDGKNDVFTLYAGHSLARIRVLQVFDRWGELIYENRNFPPSSERDGWDAIFKGKSVPADVYIWRAELDFSDGQTGRMQGDVTIIR